MNAAITTTRPGTRSVVPALERHPDSIAELAYRLYEERGRQAGHELEDWAEAERRIADAQVGAR